MTYEVDGFSIKNETDESELDESCFSESFEVNGESSEQRKNEEAIDQGIAVLKKYLELNEEKAHNSKQQLEQLGLFTNDFPDDLKSDLRETFKDDNGVFSFSRASGEMVQISADHVLDSLRERYELGQLQVLGAQLATLLECNDNDPQVFSFPRASGEMVRISAEHVLDSLRERYELGQLQVLGAQLATLLECNDNDPQVFSFPRASGEMVRISAEHVLDSLRERYELGQLQVLSAQLATLVDQFSCQRDNLERKLNAEKYESDKLDEKRFDKEANLMMSRKKLKDVTWELENLQKLSLATPKPKYTFDDLEKFKQEICTLESDIAFTNTKLNKYHKLSLSEKEAQKQLDKLKIDFKKVDNEFKTKIAYQR